MANAKGPLTGKRALVTGGGTGIGKATALAFARAGARVAIANRTQATGEETVRLIQAAGGEALWVCTDVTQPAQVEALVRKVVAAYGHLDYAFNNASSGGKGDWVAAMEPEEWDKTIAGCLTSVFLCMKHEIAAMLAHGGGAIVNNSSVDGERAFPWDPGYCAAKHGVLGLTKAAALQYAQQGIRINAVCPGWILTPPVEGILTRDPEAGPRLLQHQPIGRFGTADEVAEAVVWLCSDKASLILGTALAVDGGYLAL